MAYFVADEKLQGYYVSDGVTINIVKYHFECDDAASLPAQTAFISSKKVKISMASTAHTIDTDALYKMDSSGAWIQQSQPWQPLADYSVLSNKPQINGHTLTSNQSGADLGLQNTLTFDAAPTQNSTNPVTSGGVWTDQQRQEAEIGVVANAGAKNFAPVNSGSGTSVNLFNRSCFVPAGNYILTYKASDFSGNYELSFYNSADTYIPGGLNGSITETKSVEFTLREDAYRMRFSILGTATITDLMIRHAAITDPTFQPYARTNPELTVLTDEDREALVELVDGGAKNLLKITASSSSGNVDFTVNGDGTITVDGTAGTSNVVFVIAIGLTIPAGNYYISMFDNSAYYSDKMYIAAQFKDTPSGSSTWIGHEYYADTQINPAGDIQSVAIVVKAGQTISQTVQPMICTKAARAISHKFVPYRPSWQEMYDMILALH